MDGATAPITGGTVRLVLVALERLPYCRVPEVRVTVAVTWLDGVVVTVHCVEGITAPMTPVLVAFETVSCEVGVTLAVICEDGVVVTVHCELGMTAPITLVLVAIDTLHWVEGITAPMTPVLVALATVH